MANSQPTVRDLLEAIARGDTAGALRLVDSAPELARGALGKGATRADARANFRPGLGGYLYEGDTPLHTAAAAKRAELLARLIAAGADMMARNRLGATPLHYAASGNPDSPRWNPAAQAEAIGVLVAAGADPNATDKNGSTPLHKAIRTRCAAATEALLKAGADPAIRTKNGSTPLRLAGVTSGRGGSGSPAAKAQQAQILALLERAGAAG
jgi:hypothetical protein